MLYQLRVPFRLNVVTKSDKITLFGENISLCGGCGFAGYSPFVHFSLCMLWTHKKFALSWEF